MAEATTPPTDTEKRALRKNVRTFVTKSTSRDARVTKVEGFTFDQVQSAVSEALCDKYPTPEDGERWNDGPWIRDIFDESVVFTYEGVLMSVPYTFANGAATLSGEAVPVKVVYQPIDGAAPPAPDADDAAAAPAAAPPPGGATPDAAAGKRILEETLFGKASKGADAAIASLAKRAKPPEPVEKKAPLWPADMSPRGKPNTLGRAR